MSPVIAVLTSFFYFQFSVLICLLNPADTFRIVMTNANRQSEDICHDNTHGRAGICSRR